MRNKKGFFVVIDGIDGAGCSTHSRLLVKWLKEKGYNALLTKEPQSKGRIGRLIRKYLQIKKVSAYVDALLFAADRAEHVEKTIVPALERGKVVVSDRYLESSIAYQGAEGLDINWIQAINKAAITPNLTIVLKIDPSISLKRKKFLKREKFESEKFLKKVKEILLLRAKEQNYEIIESDASIEETQQRIRKVVSRHLDL